MTVHQHSVSDWFQLGWVSWCIMLQGSVLIQSSNRDGELQTVVSIPDEYEYDGTAYPSEGVARAVKKALEDKRLPKLFEINVEVVKGPLRIPYNQAHKRRRME